MKENRKILTTFLKENLKYPRKSYPLDVSTLEEETTTLY
jgi:hypothetical protein